MQCNLCESANLGFLYKGNIDHSKVERFSQYTYYGDLYKCESCGLIVQKLDHNTQDIIEKLTTEEYLDEEIGHLNIEEKYSQFEGLIKYIQEFSRLENANILDAGANTGVFLSLMKKYSSNLQGIEPSSEACENAKKMFDLNIQNSVIGQASVEDDSMDIITMWDVIEHLYDPKADLTFLRSKLKKDGKIFISTHNIGDFVLKLTGKKYPLFMYQHFFHFSKKTMSEMLERCGYRVLDSKRFCKSWTLGYFYQLIDKQWPDQATGKILKKILAPINKSKMLRKALVPLPIPHFFIIVAEKK